MLDLDTKKFNFILLDLGFSSNQLDDDDIGLSFKINSELNMNYLGGDLNAYKIINYYLINYFTKKPLDLNHIT